MAQMGGSGCTYYINSVILIQTWNYIMNQIFNTTIWETWEKQFLSMLVEHAGPVLDPYTDRFLGV